MLLEDPNSRLTSSDLCEKLREILVSAKAEHSLSLTAGKAKPIANTIFEALLDVDQTASSNVGEIADIRAKTAEGAQHMSQPTTNSHSGTEIDKSLTVPRDQQKGKPKRIGKSQRLGSIPLGKVAHRAEVLETALNAHDEGVEPDQPRHSATKINVSTGSMPPHFSAPAEELPPSPPNTPVQDPTSNSPLKAPALQTLDPSLDIVKVRQELENKRARGLEAQFAPFLRRNKKDQYLGNFIKDRDIVSLLDT